MPPNPSRPGRLPGLDARQRAVVTDRLGPVALVADLSWGLVDTVVLHVRAASGQAVVKAGGPQNHHLAREIRAHRRWPGVWGPRGPHLLTADVDARVLATAYLPGTLVDGTPAALDPDVHRQAGGLLAALHRQEVVDDDGAEAVADARALAWLERPHRVPAHLVDEARRRLSVAGPAGAVQLVPTHGDWQPRNWLIDDDGVVRVIDLGRADLRPAWTDLSRLAAQQWQGRPDLERAFLEGYGTDPRGAEGSVNRERWERALLREAIGTAAWAHQVGDEAFEAQGLRMLADALAG